MEGSIVDASIVDVPRQRNSKDENDTIKNGETPEEWEAQGKENMVEQKDVDARWTKKNDETHFGYKNRVKADKDSKLIVKYEATSAEVYDSQMLEKLIDKRKDKALYADSAYKGEEIESCL